MILDKTMKSPVLYTLALLVLTNAASGQSPKLSAKTQAYQLYRYATTAPSYGLAKVRHLIAHIKKDSEGNQELDSAAWTALTTKEKFTYCMLHGEDFSQNCNMMPLLDGMESKIFAFPASSFDEDAWSKRQRDFLHAHRGTAIQLLRQTIRRRHRVGSNLKEAVTELKARELVPDLIAVYKRDRRDQDILSTLMDLMRDAKFKPFLESAQCNKVYNPASDYQSYLTANRATEDAIIKVAQAYFVMASGTATRL